MSCRRAATAATYKYEFFAKDSRPMVARAPIKTNIRRGGVSPPACRIFILHPGGALMSLPCVRGGAARSAAEGLYLT